MNTYRSAQILKSLHGCNSIPLSLRVSSAICANFITRVVGRKNSKNVPRDLFLALFRGQNLTPNTNWLHISTLSLQYGDAAAPGRSIP